MNVYLNDGDKAADYTIHVSLQGGSLCWRRWWCGRQAACVGAVGGAGVRELCVLFPGPCQWCLLLGLASHHTFFVTGCDAACCAVLCSAAGKEGSIQDQGRQPGQRGGSHVEEGLHRPACLVHVSVGPGALLWGQVERVQQNCQHAQVSAF